MKVCTTCKTKKPLTDFFKSKLGAFGRDSKCKKCKVARLKEIGHWQNPRYRAVVNSSTYRKVALAKYRAANKLKIQARNAVNNALIGGKINRRPCFCGTGKVEAHHHKGYDKPNWLNIIWLCKQHHVD